MAYLGVPTVGFSLLERQRPPEDCTGPGAVQWDSAKAHTADPDIFVDDKPLPLTFTRVAGDCPLSAWSAAEDLKVPMWGAGYPNHPSYKFRKMSVVAIGENGEIASGPKFADLPALGTPALAGVGIKIADIPMMLLPQRQPALSAAAR